jgi:cation:H+ antiporter
MDTFAGGTAPFVVGIVLAAIGGELFVTGAIGLAHRIRIPSGIVAATIGAIASASPEFSVAIAAAIRGDPGIALGNALGSNVVNLGLILGLTLAVTRIRISGRVIRRDFVAALAGPVLTLLLSFNGRLTRVDGGVMLLMFAIWIAATGLEAARHRANRQQQAPPNGLIMAAIFATSVLLLAGAGQFLVAAAIALGETLGLRPFVVSTTLVSIGTDIPELAVSLVAIYRGHPDISLGAVLGSNIFNSFAVVGSAALIHPFDVSNWGVRPGLAAGILLLLSIWPSRKGSIGRWRSSFLLGLYAAYVLVMSISEAAN